MNVRGRILFPLALGALVVIDAPAAPKVVQVSDARTTYEDGSLRMVIHVQKQPPAMALQFVRKLKKGTDDWMVPAADLRKVIDCGFYERGNPNDFCFSGCICRNPKLISFDEKLGLATVNVPQDVGANAPSTVIRFDLNKRAFEAVKPETPGTR